jgi:hypothetical protein
MLARLERGLVAELRCDFRRYYSCSYDETPTFEAIDLIRGLPDGSLYVSRKDYSRSWSDWKHALADIQDEIIMLFYASRGAENPPRVTRPNMVIDRVKADKKRKEVRKRLKS